MHAAERQEYIGLDSPDLVFLLNDMVVYGYVCFLHIKAA